MPIPITCACGRNLRVKDEAAGRKIRCPDCSTILTVPLAEAPPDPEDEALSMLLEDSPDKPTGIHSRSWDEPSAPIESRQPPPRPSGQAFPKGITNNRPAISKSVVKPKPKKESSGGLFNNVQFRSWIAIPGLITMLIAVVWFCAGWMGGYIFPYAIVLFFMGGGAFFRGITRNGGD